VHASTVMSQPTFAFGHREEVPLGRRLSIRVRGQRLTALACHLITFMDRTSPRETESHGSETKDKMEDTATGPCTMGASTSSGTQDPGVATSAVMTTILEILTTATTKTAIVCPPLPSAP